MNYPSARYGLIDGQLVSETINGPDEERPGWFCHPMAHQISTVREVMAGGHTLEQSESVVRHEERIQAFLRLGYDWKAARKAADSDTPIPIMVEKTAPEPALPVASIEPEPPKPRRGRPSKK